jgi:hypothetical protein
MAEAAHDVHIFAEGWSIGLPSGGPLMERLP